MKLFGHPDSGHAFKVKFYLEAYGIEHEYERVDIFKDRSDRQAEFRNNARYGEVPLLLHNDRALTQSNAILLYLAKHTGHGLGSQASSEQICLEWLMWEANKIGMCLPQLRSFLRFEMTDRQSDAKLWLHDRYLHDVGVIEETLSDGRPWIIDDAKPTIADFSLCGYLVLADEAQVEVPEKTKLWLDRLAALKGFQHPYKLLN